MVQVACRFPKIPFTYNSVRQCQKSFRHCFSLYKLVRCRSDSSPKHAETEAYCVTCRNVESCFLQDEMKSRYERLKVIALDELNQDDLSAPLMIKLVFEIRREVKQYNSFYNEAFSRYMSIPMCFALL